MRRPILATIGLVAIAALALGACSSSDDASNPTTTSAASGRIRIGLEGPLTGDQKDTGIGMDDEEIQMALEPFRQLATARQSSGTGLGLPLTRALVEANRASFTIRSRKREGTLVEVAFPSPRVLAE